MSAPKNAIPLKHDLEDGGKGLGYFKCQGCDYRGHGSELLCVDETDMLWCPICETAAWVWDQDL